MNKRILTLVLLIASAMTALAQYPFEMLERQIQNRTSFDMMKDYWDAAWIEVPGATQKDYGVYYFRKEVDLASKPAEFKVYVSGDTRYKLYVNGELAS